jgi:hypothetical protein
MGGYNLKKKQYELLLNLIRIRTKLDIHLLELKKCISILGRIRSKLNKIWEFHQISVNLLSFPCYRSPTF